MRKTLLLTVPDVRRLIQAVGLDLLFERLADRLQTDFVRWHEFQKSARLASHSVDGVIELMPTSDGAGFSFKFVNGHPNNYSLGLPTVMGFGCLAEVETGWPLLISEMTLLTAVRTAATSVVAAKVLANSGAKSMAMIGNGAQSEFQVLAFFRLMGVEQVNLYDIDARAMDKLVRNLEGVSGLHLECCPSVSAAVKASEIITMSTADKVRASVLMPEMIRDGMHINAIGGDCPGKTEVHPSVLLRSKVFVEFEDQARIEGEIQRMPPEFPVTELWRVMTGARPGRTSASDVTLFDSVGFSIEDFSTLSLVHELARAHNIGAEIELVPTLANSRDLYGSLAST